MLKIVSKHSQHFQVRCDAFVIVFPPIMLVDLHLRLRFYGLVVTLSHEQLPVLLHGEIIRAVVSVSGEVKDDVRHNLRYLVHEINGEKLFSAEEILSLIERLLSHVLEEGSSWDDWLCVDKFPANFGAIARVILQVKLPFFDFVGEVLNEARQGGVILRILRLVEQVRVGRLIGAFNLLRDMVLE